MWLKIRVIDGVVCVYFTSAKILDEATIQQTGTELMQVVEQASKGKKLLLNFQGVQFMSSAMIGKLVLLNKKAKAQGIDLKFCDISPNVLEVFKITGLTTVFRIQKDYDKEDWKDDDDEEDDDNNDSGNTGVFAKLPKHPSSGGGHAIPPRDGS